MGRTMCAGEKDTKEGWRGGGEARWQVQLCSQFHDEQCVFPRATQCQDIKQTHNNQILTWEGKKRAKGGVGVVILLVPFHAPCQKDHDNAKKQDVKKKLATNMFSGVPHVTIPWRHGQRRHGGKRYRNCTQKGRTRDKQTAHRSPTNTLRT